MDLSFDIADQQTLAYTVGLPNDYRGYVLPGARARGIAGPMGSAVQQEMSDADFGLSLLHVECKHPTTLRVSLPQERWRSLIALKGNFDVASANNMVYLRSNQFILYYSTETELILQFKRPAVYQSFAIDWADASIAEAVTLFPMLDRHDAHGFRNAHAISLDVRSIGLVHDMLTSSFTDLLAAHFFRHQASEILLLLLVQANQSVDNAVRLHDREWDRIEAVANLLQSEPATRFPIPKLAALAHMNAMKLKLAFRQRYGMGVFEFQLAARMKFAYQLLKEGQNTKSVAAQVGYKLTTSFITKFKQHFGFGPSEVTRRLR